MNEIKKLPLVFEFEKIFILAKDIQLFFCNSNLKQNI